MKLSARNTSGNVELPADGVGHRGKGERIRCRDGRCIRSAALVDEVAVKIHERWSAGFRAVLPAGFGDGEFAVIAKGFSVREGVVPDEPARGVGQGIHAAIRHAMHIAAGEAGEGALEVFVGHGAIGPLVAIGAADAGAVSVIEQHEFARQFVLVRGDTFVQRRRAMDLRFLRHVAKNLIVSAILFDDVDDVLEDRGSPTRSGTGRGGWSLRAGRAACSSSG